MAFKAIDDLHNTNFKGERISVEKGRVKPPPRRSGGDSRGPRNGYGGGPMRGARDNSRGGAPYKRDGGNFDRRGSYPPMGGNRGAGFDRDRGGDSRPVPAHRPANDGYPPEQDRRPYNVDSRRPASYGNSGYGDNSGYGGNNRMYSDDRDSYGGRAAPVDSRAPYERRPIPDARSNGRPMPSMHDRRPMMDHAPPAMMGASMGGASYSPYDRPPQPDLYNRRERDAPSKPMGYGGYTDAPHGADYGAGYPPMEQQSGCYAPNSVAASGRRY